MSSKIKKSLRKLKNKYRLIIFNDDTYEDVWSMKLSKLNVFTAVGSTIIIFTAIITILIAFTPIREFIPGYPDGNMRRNIVMNAQKLDSLEHQLEIRDRYFSAINTIVRGEVPESFENQQDTTVRYEDIEFSRSEHDSIFRKQIEKEEMFSLQIKTDYQSNSDFTNISFYPPVTGIVTNSYNPDINHYGTDIVTASNKVVVATLDGTIIMSTWTLETGYVIQIQHENDMISIYKHNAEILKKVGNHVKAGEAIAIIGNSGELTSGPHLHFELWHNGKALDPEDYIDF